MQLSSKLLEQAVQALGTLPGIGKKSALRLALHLLQQDKERVAEFCRCISTMRNELKFCTVCHNLSDTDICHICTAPARQNGVVCVVESIKEAMAIENTQHYNGRYHVLGGLISPIEGITPQQLYIDSLVQRVENGEITELIMALSPTIEGETTIYYIAHQLKDFKVKISTIARGVSFGSELEYADETTLGRSIMSRMPYKTEQ
jgi:recombination protein RecR